MTKKSFAKVWDVLKWKLTPQRICNSPVVEGLEEDSAEYNTMISRVPYIVLWMDSHTSHVFDPVVLRNMRYHRVMFVHNHTK